jgi:hypothetical protein
MRPKTLSIAAITGDANGIAAAQQLGAAGNLVLDGAGVMVDDGTASFGIGKATLDPPRPITLTSAGNLAGITFTVYGYDRGGQPISESLAGPNNATVTTTKYFKVVTRIAAGAAVGSDVEAGWGTTAASAPFVFDIKKNPFNASIDVRVTGTVNYDVQYTHDNVFADDWNEGTAEWRTHATLDGLTADADGYVAFPVTAARTLLNSGTGSVATRYTQAGV